MEQYHIHANTKNLSFIKMHMVLKAMGIKNNKFFLALYDNDLEHVDPHDPELSNELKIKVAVECKKNMWYFVREVIRVPVEGGHVRYDLDMGVLSQLFLMNQNINIIKEQPRQTYKTITTVSFYLWVFLFRNKNSTFMFSNKAPSDSNLNVKRFKDMRAELPRYLRMIHKKDISNVEYVKSMITSNVLRAMSTATNVQAADKMGRGMTAPLLWFDEIAFLKFNKYIFEAAAFAFMKASENAMNNNVAYGVTMTTTPNKMDLPEGAFCKMLMDKSTKWTNDMFDMTTQEILDYIHANSADSEYVHIRLTWQELGKTDAWYQRQCKAVFNDIKTIKREIDLRWAFSSDVSLFDEEVLEQIALYKKPPIHTTRVLNKYPLYEYEQLDSLIPYNVSVDVAAGLGRDFTAIVISRPTTMRTAAIFFSNRITLPSLKDLLYEIMEMLPNAFLTIERNNHGISIIQEILQNPKYLHLTNRLFYVYKEDERMVKSGKKEKSMVGSNIHTSGNKTKVYGVDTNNSSRELMLDLLADKMNNNPEIFVSEYMFDQIAGLENKKSGKIEHADGGHDDILFAFLVGLYASSQSTYGKFLANGYIPDDFNAEKYHTQMQLTKKFNDILKWNRSEKQLSEEIKDGSFDSIIHDKKEMSLMETIRAFNRDK